MDGLMVFILSRYRMALSFAGQIVYEFDRL